MKLFQNHTMEWFKTEMEKYKKLYYELQTEIDKLDNMRKNYWTYFALKRENFVKSIAIQQPQVEEDLGCDCQSMEETPVFRSPLYRW